MRIDQVVKPNSKVMSKLAQDTIDKITLDASEGKFQNGKSGYGYKNDTYKRYKANSMQGRSGKLKAYKGQSTDTTTSFVNMRLTGRTLRGMRASGKTDTAIITYDRGEIVLGNQKRGYDIYDLSNKNKEFIAERFGKELLDRNIKKYVSKTTTIK
jgi:hypothetical protein|tara:strand:+ start:169 stop:633 length:465 start_codon:yes stop_codon:yes gene_type:complete